MIDYTSVSYRKTLISVARETVDGDEGITTHNSKFLLTADQLNRRLTLLWNRYILVAIRARDVASRIRLSNGENQSPELLLENIPKINGTKHVKDFFTVYIWYGWMQSSLYRYYG